MLSLTSFIPVDQIKTQDARKKGHKIYLVYRTKAQSKCRQKLKTSYFTTYLQH
jgi:hypothetical protein